MSGWIEFFDEEVLCPYCEQKFTAHFIEDADVCDPPSITTSLAGATKCPHCSTNISDSDFPQTNS